MDISIALNGNLLDKMIEIAEFCESETKKLIAQLEQERFAHQGQFNDHEQWSRNSKQVELDKGFNLPLVDTGKLEKQLSTPENWKLNPQMKGDILTLTIPDNEHFTDSKYDKLEYEQGPTEYISPRGNRIKLKSIPARKFKAFSQQDTDWIVRKLTEAIINKFR